MRNRGLTVAPGSSFRGGKSEKNSRLKAWTPPGGAIEMSEMEREKGGLVAGTFSQNPLKVGGHGVGRR